MQEALSKALLLLHDDHTKNHSFLMDESGVWSLAPAYDLTYANLPGHPYLEQHRLGVQGRFIGITDDMMLGLADTFAVPNSKADLRRVRAAVDAWPEFATAAGVSTAETVRIREAHQSLGRAT